MDPPLPVALLSDLAGVPDPRFTVFDPETKKYENLVGPAHGTPEAEAFWRPVLTHVRGVLDKHGLADRILIGCAKDGVPTGEAVRTFHNRVVN